MEGHRTYLRAELGKLRDHDDAAAFLRDSQYSALGATPEELAERFATQDGVDSAVLAMSDGELVAVTDACDRWRNNGIVGLLGRRQTSWTDAPVTKVHLRPAEPHLATAFAAHGWRLHDIALDPVVLEDPAYRDHRPGEPVAVRELLAERQGSAYRLCDGMHRAIQLARSGDPTLRLCVLA